MNKRFLLVTVFVALVMGAMAQWIEQASGFATPSRGIHYLHAVDENVVWASAYDGTNPSAACSDFTHTTNGGTLWTAGTVTNSTGLSPGMIFGVDDMIAYMPMYRVSGSLPQGIYATFDGGATWARQTSASFSNSYSFPNIVHFWDENTGWCQGDPINSEFEMYTTNNGGNTWTAVPGANIPAPLSGEWGVVGYYSVVGDNVWFGTNKGRVFYSPDKGVNWDVYAVTPFNNKYIEPFFKDEMNGLVQDKSQNTTGALCETMDGGVTWTEITFTGNCFTNDLGYIPNTANTYLSTGADTQTPAAGVTYSYDGGHTWIDQTATIGMQFLATDWVNPFTGWAGAFNVDPVTGGMYKFTGFLSIITADTTFNDVYLTWEGPVVGGSTFTGYNVYRNGTKINTTPVDTVYFEDFDLATGTYNYTITALTQDGESEPCDPVYVTIVWTSVNERSAEKITVSPNPASEIITVKAPVALNEVFLMNNIGQVVFSARTDNTTISINVTDLQSGIYVLKVKNGKTYVNKKVVVN
ncbi:MAG: T9SS type A sorting domain-containing protein [Bacteroidetes bacterium]|nr:T9SS type A sorting domain-containing protein [Bacteroidota bacterium]